MLRSMAKKLEIEMYYGQVGYASVASIAATVITIPAADWAPGIWAGAEGMPIEIRDVTGATVRGLATVTGVSFENRTITLDAAPGGVVATDVIWHKGAYGNEFPGLVQILSQQSGTLFNINVASYNLFRGNTYGAGSAALSFNKLNAAAARAVEKGLDGALFALVNPRGWSNMLNDQAANRRFDSSYSAEKGEIGSKAIKFHSQNGDLEVEASIYVKEGLAFLLSVDDYSRIGSTDMTFKRPGSGDDFLRELENSAGMELRLFSDQALFCSAPGRSVLINAIVNSA